MQVSVLGFIFFTLLFYLEAFLHDTSHKSCFYNWSGPQLSGFADSSFRRRDEDRRGGSMNRGEEVKMHKELAAHLRKEENKLHILE